MNQKLRNLSSNAFLALVLLLGFHVAKAQTPNVQNYAITAGSNESLIGGGGWTQLIGPNTYDASAIANIGFEVWFMGERFTQFSINTNGVLRFGPTPVVAAGNTPAIPGNARVAAFSAATGTDAHKWRTESDGSVRYKVVGTAPNRMLVVDWNNMRIRGNETHAENGISRFQMHIYETAPANTNGGVVKIVYGRMRILQHASTAGCAANGTTIRMGIGYIQAPFPDAQRVAYLNTDNHPTVGGGSLSYGTEITACNAFGAAPTNVTSLNSNNNTSRRFYNFNPPLPDGNVDDLDIECLSSFGLKLTWTENATNEVGIVIYRSTDGTNFTFYEQLPADATSYTDIGLTPGTTYYYNVYTVTEGRLSELTATNSATATTPGALAVHSVVSNNWTNILTWTSGAIPLIAEDVVIGCIAPHTVQVNGNGFCNDLIVEEGSILNVEAGRTLTVNGSVFNNGTINVAGTLIINGNLNNNATAIFNNGTGTVRLRGDFITDVGSLYSPSSGDFHFDGNTDQYIDHNGESVFSASQTDSYVNNTSVAIPDATSGFWWWSPINPGQVTRTINVPDNGTIENISFDININHNWVGDIEVSLTSPDGTTRTLINRPDGGNCSGSNISATLDDGAATSVDDECAAATPTINGTFTPTQTLAAFNGEEMNGNWTITIRDMDVGIAGTFLSASLNITYSGGVGVPINGLYFHNLHIDQPVAGNDIITQNTDVYVINSATWANGVFRPQTVDAHRMIFLNGSSSLITAASLTNSTSFADCWVEKRGNNAFDFPTGSRVTGEYAAPISIGAPSAETTFEARYIRQSPNVPGYDITLKEATIDHVSGCEYWYLNRIVGTGNASVSLSYENVRSCGVYMPAELKVCRWDGSEWIDHFNGGNFLVPYAGLTSAGAVTNFSPFSLGSNVDAQFNPLPVSWLSFEAQNEGARDALLTWETTAEENNSHFVVERSADGKRFEAIGKVEGLNQATGKSSYHYYDRNAADRAEKGVLYYRLRQVDFDGTYAYSSTRDVYFGVNAFGIVSLAPNPFSGQITVTYDVPSAMPIQMRLIDMHGRVLWQHSESQTAGRHSQRLLTPNYAKGTYILQLIGADKVLNHKIVKE
ncbi:MAG: proprotein convertase P-domain-containing protein [Bernardetiaceae bacterium]|nr:proprotein convertase P-domain-containing protein [Bernardetiaceae bacterium]